MLSHADFDSQFNAVAAAPHWYIAFSGGLDSTVLLHLLHRWRAARPGAPALSAIHINHGLQVAADDWQQHCEAQCNALDVSFIARNVDVHSRGSGEAAARDARYRAFEELVSPGGVLFMGHHLDDQVETFFLRLLRGAGVEGLTAMPRQRALGAGHLLRPLLAIERAELQRYAQGHGLAFVEDPSNLDSAMDRNFLRAQVLPLLATRWPAYRKSVARTTAHMSAAAVVLAENFGAVDTVSSALGDPGLALGPLTCGPGEVAAACLRGWLHARGYPAPDRAALDEFLRQLRVAPPDGNPRLDCGSYTLQRYRDGIYRVPALAAPPAEPLTLAQHESRAVPGVGVLSLQAVASDGLWLEPGEALTLRWRKGGERCRLPGRAGSRSLKVLLQEWCVPPWWRHRVPLLYLGSELLAVADLACCESSRWRTVPQPGEQLWNLRWERPENAGSD